MKRLLLLTLIIFLSTLSSAQNSGYGCKINQGFVYTEYLGKASAYTGTAPIHYFKSTGHKIPFYWGYGLNLHRGYRCGYINMYPASTYWDSTTQKHIPIPAEAEFTYSNEQCVISTHLGGPVLATDTYGYYTYNRTKECGGGSTTPVPIDDYIPYLIIAVSILVFYSLKLKSIV